MKIRAYSRRYLQRCADKHEWTIASEMTFKSRFNDLLQSGYVIILDGKAIITDEGMAYVKENRHRK